MLFLGIYFTQNKLFIHLNFAFAAAVKINFTYEFLLFAFYSKFLRLVPENKEA
ncbi:hypothetical protein B6N60_01568 [Richelia sinica FACHB-800]|uniref:Uncharacterized protein n=1 Tax=Richelia sinica FACHB-800 TaxID=1357546 RepID=A0A975T608_9NOST|nr:hypothetical protein B6N60_01568 [Richelia sinica FACHB-800]